MSDSDDSEDSEDQTAWVAAARQLRQKLQARLVDGAKMKPEELLRLSEAFRECLFLHVEAASLDKKIDLEQGRFSAPD